MTRQQAKEIALKHCKPFTRHSFDRWVFPVIRNMPQGSLLQDLVSVQPMSEPPPGQEGYVYAPYIPLYVTRDFTWRDRIGFKWRMFKRRLSRMFNRRIRACRRSPAFL